MGAHFGGLCKAVAAARRGHLYGPDVWRSLGVPDCSGAKDRLLTARVPARQAQPGRHGWHELPRERGPISGAPNALARSKPARPPQFAHIQHSFHSRRVHAPAVDEDFPKPRPSVAVASAPRVEYKNRRGRILGVCVRRELLRAVAGCMDRTCGAV